MSLFQAWQAVYDFGPLELIGGVPSGLVEQDDGMSAGGDHAGDFLEMGLHGMGIGAGHDEGGALGLGWGHGAEEIGALIALVLGLPGPGSLACPLAHQGVLLAEAHLVLEPDLDRRGFRQAPHDLGDLLGEVFLKSSSTWGSWPGW